MDSSAYRGLLAKFMSATPLDIEQYASKEATLVLPVVPKTILKSLCSDVTEHFRNGPSMLEIQSPCHVIGDLHGHILDLFRVMKKFGGADKTTYLFLGDLVDRGEFSIETVVFVFLLKVVYPDTVHIIRGNHEFEFLAGQCGFSKQLDHEYDDPEIFDSFLDAFSYMPLSCLIDKTILCVHGGLGPSVFSLNQLRKIERPVTDYGEDLIDSILWSDPQDNVERFQQSNRGTGYFFGREVTKEFMTDNHITTIVRGHECVMNGVNWTFDNSLVTVFTASNYCGLMGNQAAVLVISGPSSIEAHQFPPLKYLQRDAVTFRGPKCRGAGDRIKPLPSLGGGFSMTLKSFDKLPSLSNSTPRQLSQIKESPTRPRRLELKVQPTLPAFRRRSII